MANQANLVVEISTKVLGAAAVLGFAKDIIGAASDMEQSLGGVDAVFKENSSTVKAWADQASKSVGLSKADYQDLATTIGTQLKGAGTAMSDLAPKTDALIKLGADMAATYGGTTKDAVDSLASALKGENDPIQNFGVNLTASAVAAKKAEMGMAGLTGAADQQATQLATLALITEKTKDAQGQFATQSDSTAEKQQTLNAEFENSKATMGASLLPAWNGILEVMNKFVPIVAPIVTALGNLVSGFASLPGPLIAAGLALGVWLKYGKQITSSFKDIRAGASNLKSNLASVGTSIAQAGLIAVAAWTVGKIIEGFTSGARAAEEFKGKVSDLADSIVDAGGKWSDASTKIVQAQVEQNAGFAAARAAGLSYSDAMKLFTGDTTKAGEAQTLLAKVMNSGISEKAKFDILSLATSTQTMIGKSKTLAAERQDYAKKEAAAAEAAKKSAAATGGGALAAQQAAAASKKVADAAKKKMEADTAAAEAAQKHTLAIFENARAHAEAAASSTALQRGLDADAKSADEAKRAVDGLNQVIDALTGRNHSAEETAAALNQSFIDMGDEADTAAKAHDLNTSALKTWNVAALTANKTGQDVFKTFDSVSKSYIETAANAFTAAEKTGGLAAGTRAAQKAADGVRSRFISMAQQFGLTGAEAAGLADKLGIVEGKKLTPKKLKLITEDKEAKDKVDKFNAAKTPDKQSAIVAHDQAAKKKLAAWNLLGANDKQSKIDADPKPATQKLDHWNGKKMDDKTAVLHATDTATGTLDHWNGKAIDDKTGNINAVAHTTDAETKLDNAARDRTVNLNLHITEDRLTRVRTVTDGAATPGPRAVLPEAFAAPAPFAAAASQSSAAAAGGTVINVNGALDPDAVARQISRLLTNRSRRNSGVHIGDLAGVL